MQNPRDISHIDKIIQKNQANIKAQRSQTQNQRRKADELANLRGSSYMF